MHFKTIPTLVLLVLSYFALSQSPSPHAIKSMKWGEDMNIAVELYSDTNLMLSINDIFHAEGNYTTAKPQQFTYYPVALSSSFIKQLEERDINLDSKSQDSLQHHKANTLWSAIHNNAGGGWEHFINILYLSLENRTLDLKSPLLKRPESNWKPDPITDSYKRTKKWKYFIPETQKIAQKEFKILLEQNELGDLANLPKSFLKRFSQTNDKEYKLLLEKRKHRAIAQIELVRLIIASKYLGVMQIQVIKNMALKSTLSHARLNQMPSVIIFDDLEAAVAMRLDEYGYHIEKIIFKNENKLKKEEYESRVAALNKIVAGINEMNKKLFEQKLSSYYK